LKRGEIWMADFGQPRGSAPALVRPAAIISADEYNASTLRTVVVASLTTNLRLAATPGNVLVPAGIGGATQDSVVNVTQLATLDRLDMLRLLGELPDWLRAQLDDGLRKSLALT
jgi:mRNA interferase MazF